MPYPPSTVQPHQNPNQPALANPPKPVSTFLRRCKPDWITNISCFTYMVCVVTLLNILIILWAIYMFVVVPRNPEFIVTSLSVSNFNFSNTDQVSGNWNLQFTVRNPNKKFSFSYGYVKCSLSYDENRVADTRLPTFDQGNRDQRTVNAKLSGSPIYVDTRVYNEIGRESGARGSVGFDVTLISRVKSRYLGIGHMTDEWHIKALCEDLAVDLLTDSGSGKMNGLGKKCKVSEVDD